MPIAPGDPGADTGAMQTATPPSTRVFIVDDSRPIRERLAGLIRKLEGVTLVGEAETPAAAISGILDQRPDAVVLDVQLLGGTGLEVLTEVHPKAPAMKFLVLTNHPSPQYRSVYLAAGASRFMDKNSEFARIADVIGELRATSRPDSEASNQ